MASVGQNQTQQVKTSTNSSHAETQSQSSNLQVDAILKAQAREQFLASVKSAFSRPERNEEIANLSDREFSSNKSKSVSFADTITLKADDFA